MLSCIHQPFMTHWLLPHAFLPPPVPQSRSRSPVCGLQGPPARAPASDEPQQTVNHPAIEVRARKRLVEMHCYWKIDHQQVAYFAAKLCHPGNTEDVLLHWSLLLGQLQKEEHMSNNLLNAIDRWPQQVHYTAFALRWELLCFVCH